jgi:electron transfer flavoprotein beta subunit
LSAAIEREGFDLVIAGMESTDGYTGTVPQMMSEILDVPCLSFARKVDVEDGTVTIERQTASGYEVVSASLPALLAVTAGVVEPRYPTFKGIMQAKSKPVETLTAADLGVEPYVGQTISNVEDVEARESGTLIEDEGDAYLKIVEVLEEAKVI